MAVPVPVDALKRFADELQGENNLIGNRFLETNMGRVDAFIHKPNEVELPPLQGAELTQKLAADAKKKEALESAKKISRSRGFYDYSTSPEKSKLVSLQDRPEFDTSLGIRSRFGDGDGGFLDRWLNTDERISSFRVGEENKVMNGETKAAYTGYKRHVNGMDKPRSKGDYLLVKPYAERRAERLAAEHPSRKLSVAVNVTGRFVQDGVPGTNPEVPQVEPTTEVNSDDEDSVPPTKGAYLTLPPLTQEDADVYFGSQARTAFFDFYRQMSALRNTAAYGSTTSLLSAGLGEATPRYEEAIAAEAAKAMKERQRIHRGQLAQPDEEQIERDKVQNASRLLDGAHLALPVYTNDEGGKEVGAGHFRPASARSRFIASCVEDGVGPKPALVMRKGINSTLSLREQYIGDALACKLAVALEVMPYLQFLDISSNALTDESLGPLLQSLLCCGNLIGLNMSNNKFALKTVESLAAFLTSTFCQVRQLTLQLTGMTDTFVKFLIERIGVDNHLVDLDLSRNTLGQPASIYESRGDNGLEALASVIAHPSCGLESLSLAWNNIYASTDLLAEALKKNNSLTHLDLSFNGLGNIGGEALGAALHENKTLVTLNMAQNKLMSRSVVTIVSGAYLCPGLRSLNLADNPIGSSGTRAVITLQLRLGTKNIDVNVGGCSPRVKDPTATVDLQAVVGEHTLSLEEPYERAVCMEFLRVVARDDRYRIGACSLDGDSLEFSVQIRMMQKRYDDASVSAAAVEAEEVNASEKAGGAGRCPPPQDVDADLALESFDKANAEGEGEGLGKEDLFKVWVELGVSDNAARAHVTELCRQYDVDGVGLVNALEFSSYVADLLQRNAASRQSSAMRLSGEERFLARKGQKEEYVVPSSGTIKFTIEFSQSVQVAPAQTVSGSYLRAFVDRLKSASDSALVLEEAVSCMKLAYDEARMAFKFLLMEHGDKVTALATLLPRMVLAADARALISHANLVNIEDVCRLKATLGALYRPVTGRYDGFYFLDLKSSNDRECLVRLLEASAIAADVRQKAGLGDISQRGDWSCFRNSTLDGESFSMGEESFCARPPAEGLLQFDFSYSVDASSAVRPVAPMSNTRLFGLLHSLQFLDLHNPGSDMMNIEAFNGSLAQLEANVDTAAAEINADTVGQRSSLVEEILATCGNRTSKTERAVEKPYEHVSALERTFCDVADALIYKQKLYDERHKTRPNTVDPNTGESIPAPAEERPAGPVVPATNSALLTAFATHIKQLDAYHTERPAEFAHVMLAMRRFDVLCYLLMSKMLSCAQLACIVQKFPDGEKSLGAVHITAPKEPSEGEGAPGGGGAEIQLLIAQAEAENAGYSTFRVELVVALFAHVVDKANFQLVLQTLTGREQALLIVRLGFLSLFTVIKPPRHNKLNLAHREEKQFLRLLLVLRDVEKSWASDAVYRTPEEEMEFVAAEIRAAKEAAKEAAKAAAAAERASKKAKGGKGAKPKKEKKLKRTDSGSEATGTGEGVEEEEEGGKEDNEEETAEEAEVTEEEAAEEAEGAESASLPPTSHAAHKAIPAKLPSAWTRESHLPKTGLLRLRLETPEHASEGIRDNLSSCCLAWSKMASLANAEAILATENLQVSFITETQEELAQAPDTSR